MSSFQRREVVLSGQEEKYAQLEHHLHVKTDQNSSYQIISGFGQQGMDFSLEEALFWIMDQRQWVESLNDGFVSCKHAAFGFTRH